jgi:hypothetical protein
MKSIPQGLTSSNNSSGKSIGLFIILLNVSPSVSPPNGENPVSNTYATIPVDHMSDLVDNGENCKISGAGNGKESRNILKISILPTI